MPSDTPQYPAGPPAHHIQALQRVEHGPPLRNGPSRQRHVVPVYQPDDRLARRLAGPDLGHEPLVRGGLGPVAEPRHVDGRRREPAAGHQAPGPAQHARRPLVPAAAVAQQHQGPGAAVPAGDQSTPGMSSRVKSCSQTPSEVVVDAKRYT